MELQPVAIGFRNFAPADDDKQDEEYLKYNSPLHILHGSLSAVLCFPLVVYP